jgi:ABC-type transport system involved in multi-copper enzyme maturation permease subunit
MLKKNPATMTKSFEVSYKKLLIKNFFSEQNRLQKLLTIDPVILINFYFIILISSLFIFLFVYDDWDSGFNNKYSIFQLLHFSFIKIYLSKIISISIITSIVFLPVFIGSFIANNNILLPVIIKNQIRHTAIFSSYIILYILNAATVAFFFIALLQSKFKAFVSLLGYWLFTYILSFTPLKVISAYYMKNYIFSKDINEILYGFIVITIHTSILFLLGIMLFNRKPTGSHYDGI